MSYYQYPFPSCPDSVSRTFLLTCSIYLLLFASLVFLNADLLGLVLPILVFLLYGWWSAPKDGGLYVRRRFSSERLTVGEPVEVSVSIINNGSHLNEALIEDLIPVGLSLISGSPRHVISLVTGEEFIFRYRLRGNRGACAMGSLKVTTTDPLGLFPRSYLLGTAGNLIVFPRVLPLGRIAIRPRRTRLYAGSIPARVGGTGLEFFGVRDFQPGDPPRVINWRASVRRSSGLPEGNLAANTRNVNLKLISNQYLQERVADVGIVLDGRELSNWMAGESLFEKSVMASASLADAFLKLGNRVGLLVYGQYLDWTPPAYGKLQRERILQSLARARLGSSSVFAGLDGISTRMFPAESQIVLVSPLVNEDWSILVRLRSHAYQVLVLSPDPLAFEYSHLRRSAELDVALRMARLERKLLIRKLERAGIHVIEWDVSKPFEQVVQSQLMRYRPVGSQGYIP